MRYFWQTHPPDKERERYAHMRRAQEAIIALHRTNKEGQRIPCPTGAPEACPECLVLRKYTRAIADYTLLYDTD